MANEKAAGAPGQAPASREAAHAAAAAIMGEAGNKPDHVANREAPSKDKKFVSMRTFDYNSKPLDRGQVFQFVGLGGDARLRDLKYVVELDANSTLYECPSCGAQFIQMGLRDGHAKSRHSNTRFVPPAPPIREPGETIHSYQNRLDEWAQAAGRMADSHDERRDKMENDIAPLDLSKTQASRS